SVKPAAKKPAAKKPAAKKPAKATKAAPANGAPHDAPAVDAPVKTSGGKGNFDLVVVESPAKAKTITKYLGQNFRVLASYGHGRDLDTHKKKGEAIAGVDIAGGWKLRYTVDDGSKDEAKGGKRFRSAKQILDEIGREAAKANRVYLASDPDREGESI